MTALERSGRHRRRSTRRLSLLASVVVTGTLVLGAASARAEAPIEGVWSFNGGKVAIQAQPAGNFTGTVVAAMKLSECEHPVGELMWTDIAPQADGSFWGFHEWYEKVKSTGECRPDPTRGLTAWRVMPVTGGARFLRVCFSQPGSKSQPTIAPDGTTAGATYGCVDSALIAPLPEKVVPASFDQYVKLPSSRRCFDRSKMRIRVDDPRNDPFVKVVVKLRSGKIVRTAKLEHRRGAVIAILDLRGLPAGRFTVSVRLTTALGEHLSGRRAYRRCGRGRGHGPHLHHH
ncbi:MAG TPA: hypothetical protein VF770_06470 [Solirubrobacterales bacterium]